MKRIWKGMFVFLIILVLAMYARLYRMAKTEEYFYHRMEATEEWR